MSSRPFLYGFPGRGVTTCAGPGRKEPVKAMQVRAQRANVHQAGDIASGTGSHAQGVVLRNRWACPSPRTCAVLAAAGSGRYRRSLKKMIFGRAEGFSYVMVIGRKLGSQPQRLFFLY